MPSVSRNKIMISFEITSEHDSMRVDRFLFKATTAPKSLIYKTVRKKDVKVNGRWVREDYFLKQGDKLTVYIEESFLKSKSIPDCELLADIVFEDENIIVFNKPPGLPCQSDFNHKGGTLSEMLKSYLYQKGEYNPENELTFSPALSNRLDVNTRGLVIGAKNAKALRKMNDYIRQRSVRKFYVCLLEKMPSEKEKHVSAFIEKDKKRNTSTISENGKEISMDYRVLRKTPFGFLTEVELKTGRSHQIRAYFSSIGCPIAGDSKYGAKKAGGQKLMAYKLIFDFDDSEIFSSLNKKIITADYSALFSE